MVCFIVFAETGLLVGFLLPGDTLLVIAGLLSHPQPYAPDGVFGISVWWVALLIGLAAFVGGEVGYLIGHKAGPAVFERKESGLFSVKNVERTNAFFERFGGLTIILARFVPIVRTFAPVAAGVGHMHKGKYTLYNLIGAVLWGFGLTMFGYLIGFIPPVAWFVQEYIDLILLAAVGGTALVTLWHYLSERHKAKKLAAAGADVVTDPDEAQALVLDPEVFERGPETATATRPRPDRATAAPSRTDVSRSAVRTPSRSSSPPASSRRAWRRRLRGLAGFSAGSALDFAAVSASAGASDPFPDRAARDRSTLARSASMRSMTSPPVSSCFVVAERLGRVERVALLELRLDERAQLLLVLVGEVLGIEVAREALDEGCRQLELLRRDPHRLVERGERRLAHLVGPQQRLQHEHVAAHAQRREPRLLAQREPHDRGAVGLLERLAQQHVRLRRGRVGLEVVRLVEGQQIDLLARHELDDVDLTALLRRAATRGPPS